MREKATNKRKIMKNIMSNKFNRNLSRMKALALSALVMLGVVSFTSCGNDEPTPSTPPQPPVTVDTLKVLNQTNLDRVPEALTAANATNRFADFSFEPGTRIDFRAGDWNKLTQLLELLGIDVTKARINLGGAMLNPRENINLTDANCDLLSALWKDGLTFTVGADGAFYITATQESKLTQPGMRDQVFYSDARPITITSASELESKFTEAAQLAASQKVMVTMTGTWALTPAETNIFKLLVNPNINVLNNANITVTYPHATKARDLTGPWYAGNGNWVGNKINLTPGAAPNAFRGEASIIANDTLLWMMNTAATVGKQNFIYNVVDKDGKLINPMVGLWTNYNSRYAFYEQITKSVDDHPLERMTFGSIDMDTYNGGDGGLLILMEALAKANKGIANEEGNPAFFTPFMDNVTLNVTQNPKYRGNYGYWATSSVIPIIGTNINYIDLRRFEPIANEPSKPNFNLLFSTSSSITLAKGDIGLVLSNAAAWDITDGVGEITDAMARVKLKDQARITFESKYVKLLFQYSGMEDMIGEAFPLDISETMTYKGR